MQRGAWCQDRLKGNALDLCAKAYLRETFLQNPEAQEEQSRRGAITGFPYQQGAWCNGHLKMPALRIRNIEQYNPWIPNGQRELVYKRPQEKINTSGHTDSQYQSTGETGAPSSSKGFSDSARLQGADINIVQYLGIAADEPDRIARHTKPGFMLPLVEAGWDEAYCRKWCEENDLLSPIYTTSDRGGCWFCHNQSIDQLRNLRKNYPDLWALLLKWDLDSPVSFHADGHTVHDFDRRFHAEDNDLVPSDRRFRWKMLDKL